MYCPLPRRNHVHAHRGVRGHGGEVHADKEALAVEPVEDPGNQRRTPVHARGGYRRHVASRLEPFIVMRDPAVDDRGDKSRGRAQRHHLVMTDDAPGELLRRLVVVEQIAVGEMEPEEIVEILVVRRAEVLAVPPEPVAPFGYVELLPGQVTRMPALRLQVPAGPGEHLPGLPVLLVADPDRKIVVDPRSGVEAGEAPRGRGALEGVAEPGGPDPGRCAQLAIECPEKPLAPVRVILPGVLPVENDRDKGFEIVGPGAPCYVPEVLHEVLSTLLGRVAGVHKPDAVRQGPVAEEHGQLRAGVLHEVGPVEGHPGTGLPEAGKEDVLVRGDPAYAPGGKDFQHLGAHRAFRWPEPPGPHPENRLVVLHGPRNLDLEVFGVRKGLVRQRGIQRPQGIPHVHEQRADGVVKRRGGELDPALLVRLPVQGDDLSHEVQVAGKHVCLVGLAKRPALCHQIDEVFVLPPHEADPGEVEQDLEIEDLLVGESLRRLVVAARPGREPPLLQQPLVPRKW